MKSTGPSLVSKILSAALFVVAVTVSHRTASATLDPEEWLREAEAAYERVTAYTAVLHKQQRVEGKLLPKETIFLKFRKHPFSLYMNWIRAPYKGSELLYVAGWNEGRVRAHRGGILRFVTRNLDPRDPVLMTGNLHPVTSVGVGYLLERVAINIRKAIKLGELSLSERGQEKAYETTTLVLEVAFPKASANNYDGVRFLINQDVQSKILTRIRVYEDERLVEDYGYEKLQLDAQLSDVDFDPDNPEYRF